MDSIKWEKIYKNIINQKFNNEKIASQKLLNKIIDLKEDKRFLLLEYYNFRIQNLGKKDANSNLGQSDFKINKEYETFVKLKHPEEYYSSIYSFKHDIKCIISFLSDKRVSEIEFKNIDNSIIRNYMNFKYTPMEGRRSIIYTLMDFMKFHRYKLDKLISFEDMFESDNIPTWERRDFESSDPSTTQKRYYNYWKNNFIKGKYIDLEGNISYVFNYMHELMKKFAVDKDINSFEKNFLEIDEVYGKYSSIKMNIYTWLKEAYLYSKKYDKCWDIIMKHTRSIMDLYSSSRITSEEVLNIKYRCTNKSLTGEEILLLVGGKKTITKYGIENLEGVMKFAETYLDDFEEQYGQNIIDHFVKSFNYKKMREQDFDRLKKHFVSDNRIYKNRNQKIKIERFETLKKNHYNNIRNKENEQRLFSRTSICPDIYYSYSFIPQIIEEALEGYMKTMMRNIENIFREERGLPKVGEVGLMKLNYITKLKNFLTILKLFTMLVHHGLENNILTFIYLNSILG